jgi:hypothetical protein
MRTLEAKREPAFNVGQFQIFHVKSMFGKYQREVAACMYCISSIISKI